MHMGHVDYAKCIIATCQFNIIYHSFNSTVKRDSKFIGATLKIFSSPMFWATNPLAVVGRFLPVATRSVGQVECKWVVKSMQLLSQAHAGHRLRRSGVSTMSASQGMSEHLIRDGAYYIGQEHPLRNVERDASSAPDPLMIT